MILYSEYFPTTSLGMLYDGFLVNWLHGEEVHDPNLDVLLFKFFSSFDCFNQCNTSSNN